MNEAVLEAGELEAGLPTELKDVAVYSPSPSGEGGQRWARLALCLGSIVRGQHRRKQCRVCPVWAGGSPAPLGLPKLLGAPRQPRAAQIFPSALPKPQASPKLGLGCKSRARAPPPRSGTGARTLIVRSGGGTNGEASAVLEVWGRGSLLKELHVPKGLHGPIYNDGWFGSGAAWSPNETKLAYVAEVGGPWRVLTPLMG